MPVGLISNVCAYDMNDGSLIQPSCIFRRTAWETVGPLVEDINIPLDIDLWLKMVRLMSRYCERNSVFPYKEITH